MCSAMIKRINLSAYIKIYDTTTSRGGYYNDISWNSQYINNIKIFLDTTMKL